MRGASSRARAGRSGRRSARRPPRRASQRSSVNRQASGNWSIGTTSAGSMAITSGLPVPAQPPYAARHRAARAAVEGAEVGRLEGAVHAGRVLVIGEVGDAGAQRPRLAEQVGAALEAEREIEVIGEPAR